MKRTIAAVALLLVLCASASADTYLVDLTAGNIGQNLGNSQYAGTFSVTDTNTNQTFTAFCADLTDHVGFGWNWFYGAAPAYGSMPNSVSSPNIWANSPYGNSGPNGVGNHLDYLLTQVMAPSLNTLSNAQSAAIQAAIWQVAGNYVVANGASTVESGNPYIAQLLTLLNGGTVTGSSWSLLNGLAGYSSGHTYGGANEFLIVPNYGGPNQLQYQVLIGVTPSPEPSSLAIAGLGALGFVAYGLKRRTHR
jgi:hypothetical protein